MMAEDTKLKQQVRDFYDQVGWQELSNGFYQNAAYEDLRTVSRDYIHACHMRVLRHLNAHGCYLLDAGSGPIQYPEYLEYSHGYRYRVCADLSVIALQEARKIIGTHGLYVVCDVASLPFKPGCFDGEVSLHTLHHLPEQDQVRAYLELHRALAPNATAVVVNGWDHPPLTVFIDFWIEMLQRLAKIFNLKPVKSSPELAMRPEKNPVKQSGTYIHKVTAGWLLQAVGNKLPIEIWCWRSVTVRFLRTFIHPGFGGKLILKILYAKEELFPHFFGKYGQYPLVVLSKRK